MRDCRFWAPIRGGRQVWMLVVRVALYWCLGSVDRFGIRTAKLFHYGERAVQDGGSVK